MVKILKYSHFLNVMDILCWEISFPFVGNFEMPLWRLERCSPTTTLKFREKVWKMASF